MKTAVLVLSLILQNVALAAFPSSVPKLKIPNSHLVMAGNGLIFRGSHPIGKEDQLVSLGITDVVIFKNETKNEVQTEIENLIEAGIPEAQIHHIPFRWKQIESEQEQCEMTIEALKVLKEVYETENRSLFFHCTVGEDRTGMLAGLARMIILQEKAAQVFQSEMCERGYEAGNSGKPGAVVKSIRDELTPTFVKMAALIESGKLSFEKLDKKVCKNIDKAKSDTKAWKCH